MKRKRSVLSAAATGCRSIYLLQLSEPFHICALDDHTRVSRAVHVITAVQLTGDIDPQQVAVGRHLDVFEALAYQEISHDFTEIVLRVDSIPALRPPRPVPSTSRGRLTTA